jgi:hypothetical protein
MRLYPAEKAYPNFNDQPHERPVLSYSGDKRALAILAGVMGSLALLFFILSQVG